MCVRRKRRRERRAGGGRLERTDLCSRGSALCLVYPIFFLKRYKYADMSVQSFKKKRRPDTPVD